MSKTKDAIMNGSWELPDYPRNEPSVENILPSKETIACAVKEAKEKLLNGEFDYRELLIRKKAITDALEALLKDADVKEYLEAEHAKHGKETTYNGVKITYSGRKTYSYENCGDPEWCLLKQSLDSAKSSLEERQKFLQTLTKPTTVVNEMTGEVETIYPAAWTETNFFTVNLPKK